jgi:protein-disulfide isomerase
MTRPLRMSILLIMLLGLLAPLRSAVAADSFTPTQRAEIVQILRDALKHDPSILRDAVAALQADEGERQQAESQAALLAYHNVLVTPADPIAGNPHGDVTIVEFFDTRCPFCRRMEPVMDKLLAQDHGVKVVYKDLPILGPASVLGSKALLAAQLQDGYVKLREAVMQLPSDTTLPMIQGAAERLGLDWGRLSHDMDSPSVAQRIDANLKLAHALQIEGTPALVIGDTMVPGAMDLAELTKEVAAARSATK